MVRLASLLHITGLGFGLNFGEALKVPSGSPLTDIVACTQQSPQSSFVSGKALAFLVTKLGSSSSPAMTGVWEAAFFTLRLLKLIAGPVWTCMFLQTPYRVTRDYHFTAREHTLTFESLEEPAELEYVKQHGIYVFLMPSGMLGTFLSLENVMSLFSNTGWGAEG
ncbi:hypothetical protein U1Q18_037168 [Sarracenia purpurea var. burkii]